MINVIQRYLMIYAMLDFTAQIIAQMPLILPYDSFKYIGFRKIWSWDRSKYSEEQIFSYSGFMNSLKSDENKRTLEMQWDNLGLQILNCIIVAIIALQSELFNSSGYLKYVTQTDGSMDLLVQMSELKSKSITFVFNNKKIRKIISIQRKKEVINGTVQKLREKLVRWRKFTRTTMVNNDVNQIRDDYHRISEETKAELVEWSKRTFNKDAANISDDEEHSFQSEKLEGASPGIKKTVGFDLTEDEEAKA